MLPCAAGPLVPANFTGSTGPEMEANTQRAPLFILPGCEALPRAALGALEPIVSAKGV